MKDKGITLIALVVTIVVLLILAGFTIGSLTSDNGVIKEAKTAKEKAEKSGVEEQIEIAILEAEKKYRNPTLDNIIEEMIDNKIISDSSQVDTKTGDITSDLGYVIKEKLDDYIKIGPHKLGDVNDDGIIDNDDALLIQKYSSEFVDLTDEQKLRADVNKDGEINLNDSLLILQYIGKE